VRVLGITCEQVALEFSGIVQDFHRARRKSLSPNTGFEIFVPGRQDLFVKVVSQIPCAGAPISLDLRRAFPF
jgi:hypothetical protein